MINTLYDSYSLVDTSQKTHLLAELTRSFSDTTQLVNKNRRKHFPYCNSGAPRAPKARARGAP